MSSSQGDPQSNGKQQEVAVIGGGLVGALQALLLSKRGFKVHLYEKRGDIRKLEHVEGRSINLALSVRGRAALREVGLEDVVLDEALPMHARMIHSLSGKISQIPYGVEGQCIYSVDRRKLNQLLLSYAEKNPDVSLHFHHQLLRADLAKKKLTFLETKLSVSEEDKEESKEVQTDDKDFIFGCDGAFSSVRRQMMRWGRMDYKQEYIEHGYKELTMPPADGQFALDEHFLHIWPRGEFMMIALPNLDRSFTLTLFMPYTIFQSIDTEEDLLAFFMKNFQDTVSLIGVNRLVQDFFQNPTGNLISVKCTPHFMANSTLILGDAAHAVVPFYGQGMNSGFEDCLIFYELLDTTNNDLISAASKYSETHWKDCHAIADLSMYNYLEMRSLVSSWSFLLRKYVDNILHRVLPQTFIPLYTMVAFTRIPYAEVINRYEWQRRMVDWGLFLVKVGAAGWLIVWLYRWSGIHTPLRYRILPCVVKCAAKEVYKKGL